MPAVPHSAVRPSSAGVSVQSLGHQNWQRNILLMLLLLQDENDPVKKWTIPLWSIDGCSSPSHSLWACRWINHWRLWRMASATPDLPLPSRPQSITALWSVPNCTAWWQRHMGVSNLPRVVVWWCAGRESNPRPVDHESNMLTTTPPSHPGRL